MREVAAVVPGERSAQPVTKPLQAPLCEGVFVYGTTESSDPLWSLAVVQGPGEKHGHQRRVGSIVGDFSVAFIGYNPIKRTPSVWLMGDSGLCQAVLFDGKPRGNSANARKPAQPVKKAPQKPRGKAAVLPKEIASKIRNVSENEVWIDRAAVDQIFESYAQLVRGTRIIPARDKDRVKALRLARIRQGTLLDKLGLKNNDQVQSINGFSLTNPASALQAYARLRTATDLKLKLIRGGKPMLIDFRIR